MVTVQRNLIPALLGCTVEQAAKLNFRRLSDSRLNQLKEISAMKIFVLSGLCEFSNCLIWVSKDLLILSS